ncbi:10485_t:CDS:2, partial [Funneliformis caledonium]
EYYRSNKEAIESKTRKAVGREKQPDAIINKVQEEMNNLYLLYTDLIWIVVFNKDVFDIYNINCMLGFQIVGKFPIVTFCSDYTSLNNYSVL